MTKKVISKDRWTFEIKENALIFKKIAQVLVYSPLISDFVYMIPIDYNNLEILFSAKTRMTTSIKVKLLRTNKQ